MSIPEVSSLRNVPHVQTTLQAAPLQRRQPSSPDVLHLNFSLLESIQRGWEKIISCFKALWTSLCGCFKIHSTVVKPHTNLASIFSSSLPYVADPSDHPHRLTHPNKLFVYNQLTQNRSVCAPITVTKFSINDPQSLEAQPLFTLPQPQVTVVAGTFSYLSSTANQVHWTANFADSHLFGFCEGPLFAQDEHQVAEHPGLCRMKYGMPAELRYLQQYEAALFQNVPRFGTIDISTPLADGQTLYGNSFARATEAEIASRLTRFNNPTLSNIFAIAAPRISSALNRQPYRRDDLKALFLTSYNAFRGIKERCPGQRVVIHTGNWGAGAFGNDPKTSHLLQIAAARAAGIDEVCMYPLSQQNALQAARQLLDQITQQFPQMTFGQFLDHLTSHASSYQLLYGLGNGT
jgi:hypothetical protein